MIKSKLFWTKSVYINVTIRHKNMANLGVLNHIVILNSPLYSSQNYELKPNKYIYAYIISWKHWTRYIAKFLLHVLFLY